MEIKMSADPRANAEDLALVQGFLQDNANNVVQDIVVHADDPYFAFPLDDLHQMLKEKAQVVRRYRIETKARLHRDCAAHMAGGCSHIHSTLTPSHCMLMCRRSSCCCWRRRRIFVVSVLDTGLAWLGAIATSERDAQQPVGGMVL